MTSTHLYILLLAIVAIGTAASQSEDIPIENDNQFPPEDHLDSGKSIFNQSYEVTTEIPPEQTQEDTIVTTQVSTEEHATTLMTDLTNLNENANIRTKIPLKREQISTLMGNATIFEEESNITTQIPTAEVQTTTILAENATIFEENNNITTQIPSEEVLTTTLTGNATIFENNNNIPIEEFQDRSFQENTTILAEKTVPITQVPSGEVQTTFTEFSTNKLEQEDAYIMTEMNYTCPCQCTFDSDNFLYINCEGYILEEFPSHLHPKTTTLNLKNNNLKEIPKNLSTLKFLKILNAENNSIMDLSPGSVSELAELVVLNLASNRLIEYPKDLKNSLSLTKLEELDLSNNDIRTELKAEDFSNLQALKKLTLPATTPVFLLDLCTTLSENLEVICTGSCLNQSHYCQDNNQNTIPGTISYYSNISNLVEGGTNNQATGETTIEGSNGDRVGEKKKILTSSVFAVERDHDSEEATKSNSKNEDVKLGATTDNKPDGGVDKSVIGLIVAGMVVVVAVIVVKKNWSSITKKCSSTPRAHERSNGANPNGVIPEEVPLQDKDKSPV